MAQLTPTSAFGFNTTPFMQMMNTGGANNQGGGFGLSNKPRTAPTFQTNSLFSDNSKSALNYKPTQNIPGDNTSTKTLDVGAAHAAIDSSLPAIMPGDNGVGDATVQQQATQLKQDLSTIADSQDPDAVAKSIFSQPQYSDTSFFGGLGMMGLAIMSGKNPLEAAQAGIQGQKFFESEDQTAQAKQYAQANAQDLLKHYSADSVAQFINTGDNSVLRQRTLTPEEKRAQELEDQNRADQRQRNNFEFQLQKQDASLKAAEDRADARAAKAEATQSAKDQAAATKAEATFYKDFTKNTQVQTRDMRSNEQKRLSGFSSAEKSIDNYFKPDATDTDKQAALQLASETAFNAIQGSSSAEKTVDKINHMLGQPGLVNIVGNKLSWASGIPRDEQAKYLQTLLKMDKSSWAETYKDDLYSIFDAKVGGSDDDKTVQRKLDAFNSGHGMKTKLTVEGYRNYVNGNSSEETPASSSSNVKASNGALGTDANSEAKRLSGM